MENLSASAWISASAYTGKSRNSSEKLSYPCQVPYVLGYAVAALVAIMFTNKSGWLQ